MAAESSWTQADLDAVERAIKRGVRTVKYQDRTVTYHSLDEMLALRDRMRTAVCPPSSRPAVAHFARHSRG